MCMPVPEKAPTKKAVRPILRLFLVHGRGTASLDTLASPTATSGSEDYACPETPPDSRLLPLALSSSPLPLDLPYRTGLHLSLYSRRILNQIRSNQQFNNDKQRPAGVGPLRRAGATNPELSGGVEEEEVVAARLLISKLREEQQEETAAPVDARALQDHKSATHAAGAVVARPARPTCEIDRSNAELNLPRTFDSSSL